MRRAVVWRGLDGWRAEAATVDLREDHLVASGTQVGDDPLPYRLDYRLTTGPGWVTRTLDVSASGDGWTRGVVLERTSSGRWGCTASSEGAPELAGAGGALDGLDAALDCDLGRCPLTNTMPVLRHGLHRGPSEHDFVMAWVSVPDLSVHVSRQRYEHVRADERGSVVRYVGEHRSFVAELELDGDGLVVTYPELAVRA